MLLGPEKLVSFDSPRHVVLTFGRPRSVSWTSQSTHVLPTPKPKTGIPWPELSLTVDEMLSFDDMLRSIPARTGELNCEEEE